MRPLSPPIAEGRTAEIYNWDGSRILKLYRDWCPAGWIEYESRIAHAVHAAGLPSPAAGEIVEVNRRRGLIYEHIEGISMLQDMNRHPWMLWKHARSLAEVQGMIHSQHIQGLPSYKERLLSDIRRSQGMEEKLKQKIMSRLAALPDGQNLCHGDYHPGNVMITKTGPVVIDWMTACSGSPWTDVARTSMLLTIGPKGAGKLVSPFIRMLVRFYHRMYLRRYLALRPDVENEMKRWDPVIAAARLNEEILPERESLLKIVKQS